MWLRLIIPFLAPAWCKIREPVKVDKPVLYEYTVVVSARFDEAGRQVGLASPSDQAGMNPGLIPTKFPEAGDIIRISPDSSYRIGEVLGSGTGSAVYRASCTRSGLEVAIKFQMYSNEERQQSVETDFVVLEKVRNALPADIYHTHFPSIYMISELGRITQQSTVLNLRFMMMELLGESAWALAKRNGYQLPLETVASIGIQALEVLHHLHAACLIHGDIHPENILFKIGNSADRIILGDYGKSALYCSQVSGQHINDQFTPVKPGRNMIYLSPFELASSRYSRREDIFRLMETLARLFDDRRYSSRLRPLQNNKEALLNTKRTLNILDVLPGVGQTFAQVYEYSRSLTFSQTPDYTFMIAQLREVIQDQGYSYEGQILH